jgi:hypothetical protein
MMLRLSAHASRCSSILGGSGLQINQAEYRHAFSGWFPMPDEAP